MKPRIVLTAAGSATFGLRTVGSILQSQALHGSTVILHDIDPPGPGEVGIRRRRQA